MKKFNEYLMTKARSEKCAHEFWMASRRPPTTSPLSHPANEATRRTPESTHNRINLWLKRKREADAKNLARKFFHSLAGGNRTAQIFNLDRRSVTITETSSSASVEKWQSVLPRLSLEFNLRWNDFLLLLALCFVHEKCQQWKKFHRCFPFKQLSDIFPVWWSMHAKIFRLLAFVLLEV